MQVIFCQIYYRSSCIRNTIFLKEMFFFYVLIQIFQNSFENNKKQESMI